MKRIAGFAALALLFSACSGDRDKTLVLTGSSTVSPVIADAASRFEASHPGVKIEVQSGGSSRGIADALAGLAQFGMISRELKADESEVKAHPFAIDGVCVIVHRDNSVADLGKEQLIGIYTKKIVNWKALGGPDATILVANKAEGRATLEVFLGYTGLDSADIRADVVVGENQQAIKTVAADPNAIGYVSIGTAASEAEAGTPIRLIRCDGIDPTPENVAQGTFPITRPLQLVSKGELPPLASEFLNFVTSTAIHDLIESHLYVPTAK